MYPTMDWSRDNREMDEVTFSNVAPVIPVSTITGLVEPGA